ncbi:MAG TPA: NAD(P)-binding domain-containing protein [Gammaproteobacteria bacterium]|nr:NAD(P)-binding domain-containing protein [Gammaproteobacteria bacterium]
MKIAILGTGSQAVSVARRIHQHEVVFGSCESSADLTRWLAASTGRSIRVVSPQEAVGEAQVVLLAAAEDELARLVAAAGSFTGKFVLQAGS